MGVGERGDLCGYKVCRYKAFDADGINQSQQGTVGKEYLGRKVHGLNGGAQRPVYRVENEGNDWRVW